MRNASLAALAAPLSRGSQSHFLCSSGCLERFRAASDRYLTDHSQFGAERVNKPMREDGGPTPASPSRQTAESQPRTIYTCPMHPEVRRSAPGACPICGMTLEPVQPASVTGQNLELRDMTRRFWIGAALAPPMVLLDTATEIPSLAAYRVISPVLSMWIQFVLGTPVVIWAGWPLLQRGWDSVRRRSLNMFSLIALGVSAAYLYSLAAMFAPDLFPRGLRSEAGLIPVYFEAAAVITVLVLLGQVLELRAREATGGAIRALLNLAPKFAHRIHEGGTDEEVPLEAVQVGERLRVRPGEAVPVDGVVLEGASAVDESMVTGESIPVAKAAGAKLIGGTINGTGALLMRAERVGSDTMLARIVQMVAAAQRSRAPIQRLADIASSWFVPAVILIALAAFVV